MLTDAACRNASCPPDKPRARFADAGGLYLEVAASGSKRWFVKYRFGGKEKRLALGNYPLVSLKEAREGRDKAKKARGEGEDPVQARRVAKVLSLTASAQNFEVVAREFFETKKHGWSAKYAARWIERMEKDLFPHLGTLPVGNITAPLLLDALRRVEKRGAIETAHTLRQTAGQTLRYAVQTGRCERNVAMDLHGALQPVQVKHMAAVLEPGSAGELMRAIDAYAGQPATRAALLLSALLFQRPGCWRRLKFDPPVRALPTQI